jgi:hypothetical protein
MEKVEQGFVNIACKYHICLNLMHPWIGRLHWKII